MFLLGQLPRNAPTGEVDFTLVPNSFAQVKSEAPSDKFQGVPMTRRAAPSESHLGEVLLETYAANDGMNQLLLAHLDSGRKRERILLEAF
jgi:hypothetical protein